MSKKGLLLGSILADAFSLGAHWIYDSEKIKEEFGIYDKFYSPLSDSFHKRRRKGDQTHYGDQTLLLLDFINENKKFDKSKFQKTWIEYMKNYDGYMDHATSDTILLMESNKEWGSLSPDFAGASRIAPIVFFAENKKDGIRDSIIQTKITHNDDRVIWTAEFYARVAYLVLDKKSPTIAIEKAAEEMNNPWIDQNIFKASEHLSFAPVEAIKKLGQSCSVQFAFPSTLYLIMKFENKYKDAMIENVMAGGDSAGRGLIVGMILGAYNENEIPEKWIKDLKSIDRLQSIFN